MIQGRPSMRKQFLIFCLISIPLILGLGYLNKYFLWAFIVVGPLVILGSIDFFQKGSAIRRNYPLLGMGRYYMEEWRPKVYQYFIESDTDGTPISRIFRSIVYQRSKNELDTVPFGTQIDVNATGYEWIGHSMYPLKGKEVNKNDLYIKVGERNCKKPYDLSLFNISAMSFGALSDVAVESLNKGAKIGGFAHNTGEGGLSPYHLKHGGDLIWQIGTGYFGCRTLDGKFDEEKFRENASRDSVKMIEIKLSQGAKPGKGGILPGVKNTPEIAAIRGVEPFKDVYSPASHSTFNSPETMLEFIEKVRELSGGKPVGIKFCMGHRKDFEDLCKSMVQTGMFPDYIACDGGEGGTGAAPLEFCSSIGMSKRDGLILTADYLRKYDLKDKVKLISGGKILTGFQLIKILALGADACYSARGMMLSLGCIQSLLCNKNTCPTGVTTQDPWLKVGLVVEDKYQRVANYHEATIESVIEILAACALTSPKELDRARIWRRVGVATIKNYEELFPTQPV